MHLWNLCFFPANFDISRLSGLSVSFWRSMSPKMCFQYSYSAILHKWIHLVQSCSSKVNWVSDSVTMFNSWLLRISWGHSTLQGSVNTYSSKNPCSPSFLYNYWTNYQVFFFFPAKMCDGILAASKPFNYHKFSRKFSWFPEIGITRDLCSNHGTKTLCFSFLFCVLSHLINGKVFDSRARVTPSCILYHRSGDWW